MSFYDLSATRASIPTLVNVATIDGMDYPPPFISGSLANNAVATGTGQSLPTGPPLKQSALQVTSDSINNVTNITTNDGSDMNISVTGSNIKFSDTNPQGNIHIRTTNYRGIKLRDEYNDSDIGIGAYGILMRGKYGFGISDTFGNSIQSNLPGNLLGIQSGSSYGTAGQVLKANGDTTCSWADTSNSFLFAQLAAVTQTWNPGNYHTVQFSGDWGGTGNMLARWNNADTFTSDITAYYMITCTLTNATTADNNQSVFIYYNGQPAGPSNNAISTNTSWSWILPMDAGMNFQILLSNTSEGATVNIENTYITIQQM